ncbi:MAG: type II toxin-antitoxin system HicA family toxin [Chloroflexi bacterium]|nr:type II toxin-antitoxin system HicA family toxin [Chloroflexota bacterium]
MPIDLSRVRTLTARQIVSALIQDGFVLRRQSGSHRRYQHPDGRRVTVSFHSQGQTFRAAILRRMIRDQARWTGEDLARLGLL